MNQIISTTVDKSVLGMLGRLVQLPRLIHQYFFPKVSRKDQRIGDFLTGNRNLLIIIADPKTDKLIMAYKDKVVVNQIKSADGRKMQVVKDVLRSSRFKSHVDTYLAALAESLELKIKEGNQFFQWADGALYRIGQVINNKKIW